METVRRKQGDLTNPPTYACRVCGALFTARRVNQRYCTPQCRGRANRPPGTTTSRGLGSEHQKTRKRLLPQALGTTCPLQVSPNCTGTMTDPRHMDLDHSTPRALGGTRSDRIICSPCNRHAGARLGNRLRSTRRRAQRTHANPRW